MRSIMRLVLLAICLGVTATMPAGCGNDSAQPAAGMPIENRYAVIISGGGTYADNGPRYWDDCAFLYHTLKENGIPDDNIYVIMSDGIDYAVDSYLFGWDDQGKVHIWPSNSPLDLDGDGRPDVRYSAAKANIVSVFNELSARVGPNDVLYIYTTAHGGTSADNPAPYAFPSSTIGLWGGEIMTADELAAQVDKVKAGAVVGIFAQCYSGGFVERLAAPNRVLMSASRWWGLSSALPNYFSLAFDYDSFSYYATLAMAFPGQGDSNGDGQTTMEEAYLYALANNYPTGEEHPAYYSNPWDLGRRLSLRWRLASAPPPVYRGFVETEIAEPYPPLGQARGWHADDAYWTYRLPFTFPFGGNRYDTVQVSSNGVIFFDAPSASGANSISGLAQFVAVAPLWADLTTANPDTDIFIDATANGVTVAWVAKTKAGNRPVNVAARLLPNGTITFYYGDGNDLTSLVNDGDKTIGLAIGNGAAHYSLRNGASRLANARPVSFVPAGK